MKLSFRHYYWRWIKNQVFLFILFAILMTVARISFALYFGDFDTLKVFSSDLKRALWLGLRFDLMPLAYINLVPFLVLNLGYFLPGKFSIKLIRFFVISFLTIGYFVLCWLYVFDYGFYSYFQDHLNVLVFGFFEDDTIALLITFYKNYNLTIWLLIIAALKFCIYKLIKFLFSPFDFDLKAKSFSIYMPLTFLGGLTFLALMGRGNFTRLPLSLEDAHISKNDFINEVALNGALTFNRAIKIRKTFGQGEYDYLKSNGFSSWQDAYLAFNGSSPSKEDLGQAVIARTKSNSFLKQNPPHVVLVVMESFGSFWNDSHSEKFNILGDLKNHFDKGILFKNFLPAENGTIGSIVSVTTSQVIRPGARFLSESEFMKTYIRSSGHMPFKQSGYETHFVYGGKLGWRDLGKFLSVQKYDHLWGADEIKEAMPELNHFSKEDLGNEWGIFDEYLYTFIDEYLRTSERPQLFVVMTTSNHPPFEYPSSYQPRPLELTSELLNSLSVSNDIAKKRFLGFQYANQKMSEFLTKVQTSSLRDKTIFAITGDHSFWISKGVGLDQEFKRYAVPFFLSVPEKYKPATINTKKFGSHEDIFPTLYNLSLSDRPYVKLGEDMFSENSSAMNSSGLYANESGAYHHGSFWKWVSLDEQILGETEATPELLQLKKTSQGLIGLTDSFLKYEKNRKPSDVKNGRP